MRTIQNQTFDAERALYGSSDILVKDCSFDGPADGESAFKECQNVQVEHSFFNLRYPFWHDHGLSIRDSEMTEALPGGLVVFRPHYHRKHQTSRHQSPAGMRRCKDGRLRRRFSGVRLVCPGYRDGGLRRRERILHDAFCKPALYECTHEREIFLPVH